MDSVFVEGLRLRGRHGVHAHERENEQDFLLDIRVEFDTHVASKSDTLADAADYAHFCEAAKDVVENNSFFLIERLADTIATKILEDLRIASVEITVRKPSALPNGVPGVKIVREQL